MRALALLAALPLSGCIAVGAITGGIVGTLAPIGIAANSSDPNAKAAPETILISGLVCAGIGALIGILAVEDNKKAKPNEPEPDRRGRAAEGRDAPAAEEQSAEDPEA